MMQERLAQLWRSARDHDKARNHKAAKSSYQAILELDPTQFAAYLKLSELEQRENRYRPSRTHAIAAALAAFEQRHWNEMALACSRLLQFDELKSVRQLVMEADWSDVDFLRNAAFFSQTLWLSGHPEDALRLIEATQRRVRPSHLLAYSRALALQHCGKLDEATTSFEACLQLAPHFASAHWSLAYHQSSDPPGMRVDRIRAVQASLPQDSPDQIDLYFALFKELDDAGKADDAWAALEAGATMKRKTIDFNSEREERVFHSLQQQAHQDRPSMPMEGAPHIPVFIVGMPRTGTTLLERILGGHNQIMAGGELNDFNSALCWRTGMFVRPGALLTGLSDADLAEVGKHYLSRTSHRTLSRGYLIDKNPNNFSSVGHICRALPQARVICLDRGPMDTCYSNLKELFSGDAYGYSYDLQELADHYARFKRLSRHWEAQWPGRFHTVSYEALVSDPAAVSAGVMEFLGVPFEPHCIDIAVNAAPVATASSSQVRRPINRKSIGAWQRYAHELEPLRARLDYHGVG